MSNQITLRIHSVKCVDETGGKWAEKVGNDEIALAGFGIDANSDTFFIGRSSVYAHFDDGDIKTYSPPLDFITLTLNNSQPYPQTCVVGFLLAEEDGGEDFGSKAMAIYEKVREEVAKKKQEMSLVAAGPTKMAGPAAAAIWEFSRSVVYPWAKARILNAMKDDIFPPTDTMVTIPAPNFTWDGSLVSPPAAVEFRGHDGVYLLTYDWVLS
jgi:hypothetical protein